MCTHTYTHTHNKCHKYFGEITFHSFHKYFNEITFYLCTYAKTRAKYMQTFLEQKSTKQQSW